MNDTCHVYKLTDQQRHDIHSSLGQFNIEVRRVQLCAFWKWSDSLIVQQLIKSANPDSKITKLSKLSPNLYLRLRFGFSLDCEIFS